MKNIILTIVIIVFILGSLTGLIWFFSSRQQSGAANLKPTNGNLTAEESTYDFGTISMAAGKVSHTFEIKNIGPESLTITKIYTSCMCTEVTFIKADVSKGPFGMLGHGPLPKISQTLAPNEEAQIEVVFDPAAHGPAGLGKINRAISLENNGKVDKLDISVEANVTP